MRAATIILATLLTGLAHGQTARLEPASQPADMPAPYRAAILTVANTSSSGVGLPAISGVLLRDAQGGPAVSLPLVVPPGATASAVVGLLAWAPRQTYQVELQAGAAQPAEVQASIDWPPGQAGLEALLDPVLVNRYADEPLAWPQSLRRDMALCLLAGWSLAAGTLLIRRGRWRLALAVAVMAATTASVALLAASADTVVAKLSPAPAGQDARLLVLRARRHDVYQAPGRYAPVYRSRRELVDDRHTTFGPDSATVWLTPQDVRILRQLR